MTISSYRRNRLFCPGPTPVPQNSAQAALKTDIYHRSQEFKDIFLRARDLLHPFFRGHGQPLILTSSGTGAMEAALVNLTNENDSVLVIDGGKFGERWKKLAQSYKCNTHVIEVPWGESPSLEQIETELKKIKTLKAFFIQANETSTGVAYPIKEILALVRKHSDALTVVDAISALVAQELPMDTLGIDCLLSGSQKGFGIPPGLAFISLSERAWEKLSQRPRFYFDLKKEAAGQDQGLTAWTTAISLVNGLVESLLTIHEIGITPLAMFHEASALACREAAKALELELFSQSHHSSSLTAIKLPSHIDGSALVKHAQKKYGAIFAGGQDQVKGKIIRIAHLGLYDRFDVITALSAFELSLKDMGYKCSIGSGVSAALKVFSEIE